MLYVIYLVVLVGLGVGFQHTVIRVSEIDNGYDTNSLDLMKKIKSIMKLLFYVWVIIGVVYVYGYADALVGGNW